MIDLLIAVVLIIQLSCLNWCLYLISKNLRGYSTRPSPHRKAEPETLQTFKTQTPRTHSPRVDPLPPEVVAPKLVKPPKPVGGFGSKVE